MPSGGMADGAPVTPRADAPITPPQVPAPFIPPMGMGQTDPNQVTTKPRQMPGDGGGNDNGGPPGVDEDQSMDPAMNGAEGGPGSPASTAPNQPQAVQAIRLHAATVLKMMRTVRTENPELTQRQAYDLAREAIKRYPITVAADLGMDGINFGDRAPVGDGPITKKIKNWKPGGNGQGIPGKVLTDTIDGGSDAAPAAAGAGEAAGAGGAASAAETALRLAPMFLGSAHGL
jgi:hypothetical protein